MSEIVTVEPPQDRAVTLEEARQQLRLDGHDEDLLLGAKLWAVPPSSATSAVGATQDVLGGDAGAATRYRLYAQLRLPVLRAAAARQAGEVVRAAVAEGEREAAVRCSLRPRHPACMARHLVLSILP